MEFKEYLKILRENIWWIIVPIILIGILAFFWTYSQEDFYEHSFPLYIVRMTSQPTSDFKYSGYYGIRASDEISRNIVQWLRSPKVVKDIYQTAGVPLEEDFRKMRKKFEGWHFSSQYIEVKMKTKNREEGEKLVSSSLIVLNNILNSLNQVGEEEGKFSLVGSEPITIKKEKPLITNTLIGLGVGLILGILLAFFREYFRKI